MAEALGAMAAADDDAVANYFEVHVRRGDRWVIDCTAPTAADALAEAEDIVRKVEVRGVKVVNERYNPRTDQSAARVIFKLEKPERKRTSGFVRVIAAPRAAAMTPPSAPWSAPRPAGKPIDADSFTLPPRGVVDGAPLPAPGLLFVWASLSLAVAATLLFVFLLVVA